MIILWLQTATCFLLAFYFFFFRGAFNVQASNAIYVWVMRYQSWEINYHTAPNNKSTALPILQKIISIMVCLLGRAEYVIDIEFAKYPNTVSEAFATKSRVKPRTQEKDPITKLKYYNVWLIINAEDDGRIISGYCPCKGG